MSVKKGSFRTPFRPGRSRGSSRHAGGSLEGHRHRPGYLFLVCAD